MTFLYSRTTMEDKADRWILWKKVLKQKDFNSRDRASIPKETLFRSYCRDLVQTAQHPSQIDNYCLESLLPTRSTALWMEFFLHTETKTVDCFGAAHQREVGEKGEGNRRNNNNNKNKIWADGLCIAIHKQNNKKKSWTFFFIFFF